MSRIHNENEFGILLFQILPNITYLAPKEDLYQFRGTKAKRAKKRFPLRSARMHMAYIRSPLISLEKAKCPTALNCQRVPRRYDNTKPINNTPGWTGIFLQTTKNVC